MTEQTVAETEQSNAPENSFPPQIPLPLGLRFVVLATVLFPLLGVIAAIVLMWGWGVHWPELVILAVMYLFTGLGVTVGYHRFFSHRSFEANSVVTCILGILGSMSFQSPVLLWVALHRKHHQYSDHPGDPHSPLTYGRSTMGILRGLWHAHIGWMFQSWPDMSHYVKDLQQSTLIRWIDNLYLVWVILGLLIPTGLGFVLGGGWYGALMGLIWGGFVRVFLTQHITYGVNSIGHTWGRQDYASQDSSRNIFLLGVIAMGDGWHNNHHAAPTSARHGVRWWELDLSFAVIQLLALFRLAWNVKPFPRDRLTPISRKP